MEKRYILLSLFFLIFFLNVQLIISENVTFTFSSVEEAQCPKNGKGYNFRIYGYIDNILSNIDGIKITNLKVAVGSQTTTANCDLVNSPDYYFDCYISDTSLKYNKIQTKLTDDKGDQRNVNIQYWPTRDKAKIINESAVCYSVTNYITASYFNKGTNCVKNQNLNTSEFLFVVEFSVSPALNSVSSGLLKQTSFNLPIISPQNSNCVCTFDKNDITSASTLNCVASGFSESNKFINLLNIGETNNITIFIEDSNIILGLSEFTGNKGLGIKCPSDNTSPSSINNTNNNNDTNNNKDSNNNNDTNNNETNNNNDTNNSSDNNSTNNSSNNNTNNTIINYKNSGVENCKIYNEYNQCKQCYKGYYLVNNGISCETCSNLNTGCIECDSSDYKICKTCSTNFDKNGSICINSNKCSSGFYGTDCKPCSELNTNCETCNESGFCKKCANGYYLLGFESNGKCKKCLSSCSTCSSQENCISCNQGYYLQNGKCVACFGDIFGCQNCNSNNQCTQCYNSGNFYGFYLSNNVCVSSSSNTNNFYSEKPKMNFVQFDSYNAVNDKLYFKTHFLLLDSSLVNTKFTLQTVVYYTLNNNTNLRHLNSEESTFNCEQYGLSSSTTDLSLGNTKYQNLVNYLCSTKLNDENYAISQVNGNLVNINISEPYNRVTTTNGIASQTVDISKMTGESLEEELKNSKVYTYTTNNSLDFEYNCQKSYFWFTVSGELNEYINNDFSFTGNLYGDANIKMDCVIYKNNTINNKTLYCIGNGLNFYRKRALIQDGIYSSSTNNNEKLIIYNKENMVYNEGYCNDLIGNNTSSSSGLSKASIAGIVVAVILLVIIAGVVAFFVFKNKDIGSEFSEKTSNNSTNNNTNNTNNSLDKKTNDSGVKEEKEDRDASDGNAVPL